MLLLMPIAPLPVHAEPVEIRRAPRRVQYASPAKAGAQLRAARSWAPAFAGEAFFSWLEADKDGPSAKSASTDPGSTTPIDAERAFAADAKALGQWTAFRKWSTDDAVMFVPQPVNAQEFLKDRKDPPQPVDWWPSASWISCDGMLAINKGGWKRPDGSVGYFTTVWQRQGNGGWKWIVDSGDNLKAAPERPAEPKIVRASCTTEFKAEFVEDDVMVIKEAEGGSPDQTLHWRWRMADDGGRTLVAWIYDRTKLKPIFTDRIPTPPK